MVQSRDRCIAEYFHQSDNSRTNEYTSNEQVGLFFEWIDSDAKTLYTAVQKLLQLLHAFQVSRYTLTSLSMANIQRYPAYTITEMKFELNIKTEKGYKGFIYLLGFMPIYTNINSNIVQICNCK